MDVVFLCQFRFKYPPHRRLRKAHFPHRRHDAFHQPMRSIHRFGLGCHRSICPHEGPKSLAQFDDPAVLQFAVGFGHGIRIGHDVLGKAANGGKLVFGAQCPRFNRVHDLLHQLQINRDAGVGMDAENQ